MARGAAVVAAAAFVLAATAAGAGPVRDADGVYPESGFRLPLPDRSALDANGQQVFDAMAGANNDPRRGASGPGVGLKGPAGIMLYSPRFAQITSDLNWYLRFESGLDDQTREVAILVVAHEAKNAFEWSAHEPIARRVGVAEAVIKVIREDAAAGQLDERDAAIITLGREAMHQHRVRPETFERAVKLLGPKGLVDLTGLMGNYLSTALILTTFATRNPDAPPAPAQPVTAIGGDGPVGRSRPRP
jgi:hypothetical protein